MHHKHRFLRVIKVIVIVALVTTVPSAAVMYLWNIVMPEVFGLHTITFAQAVALFVLSKLIFGMRGIGMRGGPWGAHLRQRWQQLTPEEREKMRERLQHRGFFGRCGAEPMDKRDKE